jgi:hypothetical protein
MDFPAIPVKRDEGEVLMVVQVFAEADGTIVFGIKMVLGEITARPKAWLKAVREEVAKLEAIAREAGCHEMRIAGRDWSRVLPDYEHCFGFRNGLRKRL